MAMDFNFDSENKEQSFADTTSYVNDSTDTAASSTQSNKLDEQNTKAYNVVLTDQNSPMVILFGPPSCGKTMTLVRLTRYLSSKYTFMPDQAFKNSSNEEFGLLCNSFNAAVASDNAAAGTRYIDFMLLRVNDRNSGKTICQFVESPGELLFDPKNPLAPFPAYIQQIIACNNRKIWAIFLEAGMSQQDRIAYVHKVQELRRIMGPNDKIVFILNKVDLPATAIHIMGKGKINKDSLFSQIRGLYPNMFETFVKKGIFWNTPRYDFTAFQTGTYAEGKDANGKPYKSFQAGDDSYPAILWNIIYKRIKG